MSDTEQKPKRVMTEEQLAKRRATAAATKARKAAEKAGEVVPETPVKKARKPKAPAAPKKANGGAGAEEDESPAEEAPAAPAETPEKEKKKAKVPGAPKKEKAQAADDENKTTWQPIISLVLNMKNANYEEDGSAGEEWFQDRTYFANDDVLRRYLTDRFMNWTDEFSTAVRCIADDNNTQIAAYVDRIVATPFLSNHTLGDDFNVCRFTVSLHQ